MKKRKLNTYQCLTENLLLCFLSITNRSVVNNNAFV